MAPLTSFVGKANIFGLPFLFRFADHLHRILDGAIGDDILQSLEPHGFVGLAFFEAGARSVYTVRRPVRSIDDIKGLRIRLQQYWRPTSSTCGYSPANKSSGITWSEETFPKYIRAPMQEMPGTRMAFVGIKNDKDITDLWAYLKQFGADGAKK